MFSKLSRLAPCRCGAFLAAVVGLLAATISSSLAVAESPPPAAAGPYLTAADAPATGGPTLQQELDQTAARLRLAQRSLPNADEGEEDTPEPTSREVELLKQKDLVLQQIQAGEGRAEELAQERADLKAELDDLRLNGPSEERPFSFMLLESLNDSLAAELDREQAREAASKAALESLERAKRSADDAAKAWRRAKEQAESSQEAAERGKLALELKYATLEHELADAVVKLRQQELENQRYAEESRELAADFLEEKIVAIEQDVMFAASDLDQQLAELDKQEQDLSRQRDSSQRARQYLDERWSEARQQLDSTPDAERAMRVEVEARELARDLKSQQTQVLSDQLRWLAPLRETWSRRFRIATGDFATAELYQWGEETESLVEELERERMLIDARIDGLRADMAALDRRLQAAAENEPEVTRWLRDEQRSLRTGIDFYNDSFIQIDAAERLHDKLLVEIERRTNRFSVGEWLAVFWNRVKGVWAYELTSSDDNPITVGKVVLGALLLFMGVAISRRLSRFLGRRILPRLGVQEGAAHALGSLAFYAFAFCATLMALRLVNVPLTIFTLFGGAIAIGVGFGSQRPINNFLSGIILLTERPIRVGDMIQFLTSTGMQVSGIIEAIGTRSTRVRTESNLEIIVPNSALLENNISNWTLSDPTIRTSVSVGVMYGSPTEKVVEIMQQVAEEHIRVLDAPEAFVWFTNFGDNALEFELHFFIVFRSATEQKRIQSELRLDIERRFRDAGIVVAFPQRDVHLDTTRPLEISVLPSQNENRRRSA